MQGLRQVEAVLKDLPLDGKLRHLVKLRVSQINGCTHCVDNYLRDARAEGETAVRIDHVAVWRNAPDYSPAERAALAWAEALTLQREDDLDALHAELARHLGAEEIATLTVSVATMNAWNRLMAAAHHDSF